MNRIMGDYELYHAARKQHRYIKKIGNRYFYTKEELQAYFEGKKKGDSGITKQNSGYDALGSRILGERRSDKNEGPINKKNSGYDALGVRILGEKRGTKKPKSEDGRITKKNSGYDALGVRILGDKRSEAIKRGGNEKKIRESTEKTVGSTLSAVNKAKRALEGSSKSRKIKKAVTSPARLLKKQSDKGKKKISKWYARRIEPTIEITSI